MRYVPRRYDPALIEALALTGALDPGSAPDQRAEAIARAAAWLRPATRGATGPARSAPTATMSCAGCGAASPTIMSSTTSSSSRPRRASCTASPREQAATYASASRLVS